jgi:hypothetical protein
MIKAEVDKKLLNQEKIPWNSRCIKVLNKNIKEEEIVEALSDPNWPRIQFDKLDSARNLFRVKGKKRCNIDEASGILK